MDGQQFLKTYTDFDESFLLDDMINSTEHYMNVVPRRTGTTNSLCLYEIYKIIYDSTNEYTMMHFCNTSINSIYYIRDVEDFLVYICYVHNENNPTELSYRTYKNSITIFLSGIQLGKIYVSSVSDEYALLGNRFDEIIYETPILNSNFDFNEHYYESRLISNRVIVIHNSDTVMHLNLERSYNFIKYTPYYLFWHLNLLNYQKRMLNILGEDKFQTLCLMKGKYYGRFQHTR